MKRLSRRILASALVSAGVLLLPGLVSANCLGGGTTQNVVPPGANLADIMFNSTPPCTLTIAAGTYTGGAKTGGPANGIFYVRRGINVIGAGSSLTILQAPGEDYTMLVVPVGGTSPNGAVLQGFRLTGGKRGVTIWNTENTTNGTISNVTLRDIDVVPVNPAAHGVELLGVTSSTLDFVSVGTVASNGIYLGNNGSANSDNNLIMNSTLGQSPAYGIAVQGGNDNRIINNTLNLSSTVGQGGISFNALNNNGNLIGCQRNRVEKNRVNNYKVDGIVLTTACLFNYVGQNVLITNAYNAASQAPPSRLAGVGLWFNNGSNGNLAFGNDMNGSPESGMAVFMSSNNYIEANLFHGNEDGGIVVKNDSCCLNSPIPAPGAVNPAFNVLHNNLAYFNGRGTIGGTQIFEIGSNNNDIAYNFMTARSGFLGSQRADNNATGLGLKATSTSKVYENTIDEVEAAYFVFADTTGARMYRNRLFRAAFPGPAGSHGLRYSISPAGAKWDGDVTVGGNFWNDHPASGNPSAVTPFSKFVYDDIHGPDGSGPYADRYPFGSEHLGRGYGIVSISEPYAGQVVASQSRKTVRWQSNGCVFVDIFLEPGSVPLALNYPDIGHFTMDVPTLVPATSYNVRLLCKDSNGGAQGASVNGPVFTAGSKELLLMSPGRNDRYANGSTMRVAWRSTSLVTGVNVTVRLGGAVLATVNNAPGSFVDIALPGGANNQNQITVRVEAANAATTHRDSVDGFVMVRGASSGAVTTALGGANLRISTIQPLRWVGRSDSYTVDLDLMENGASVLAIARNLPDFGHYTWLVPEMWSAASVVRVTFKNAAGATVGSADSGVFRINYTTTPGSLVSRFRLFNTPTSEHLFTTDANEYNFLSANFPGVWLGEGVSMRIFNGPANQSGVEAVPYYRLFQTVQRLHFWTTSRNEYFFIRENFPGLYIAEGVDGYIFPTAVAGSVPLFRLLFLPKDPVHHWTIDDNERNFLVNSGAWITEGTDGFVFNP